MTDYALLVSGVLQRIGRYDERPQDIPHKGVKWLPVVNEYGEAFQGTDSGNWVIRTPDPNSPAEIAKRTEELGQSIRRERDRKLADCDWTQLHDAPVNKEAWAAYRADLRNVPQQAGFPSSIVWPVAPT